MENNILALVNDKEIKESDLDLAISRLPRDKQSYFSSGEGKKQLLDQVISFELFYNYALDNGMENDDFYIRQMEIVKKDILTQVAVNRVLANVLVTDEEVKAYYEANKEMFKTEESVSARHILVDSLEQAEEIIGKIKSGTKFEDAATEYSTCPSKSNGGNLGSFTRGRMVPEFEEAAFKLGVGEISAPVKTQFGYHIIKVEDKNEPSIRGFEEVSTLIKNNLLQERQNFAYINFVNGLKDVYKVEIK